MGARMGDNLNEFKLKSDPNSKQNDSPSPAINKIKII